MYKIMHIYLMYHVDIKERRGWNLMRKYPVVTLCGSTRFKDEFMLDDMHKSKIDMAESIFVVNPHGYIGDSTWSEISYAEMTGKHIDSLEPIDRREIQGRVQIHLMFAEMFAARQYDVWRHLASDCPEDYLLEQMVTIKKGKYTTMDPWVPEDRSVPVCDCPYVGYADKKSGYDPFKIYGKQKMARFVEDIVLKHRMEIEEKPLRNEMMEEIEWYCDQLGMPLPKEYPENMSDEDMRNG